MRFQESQMVVNKVNVNRREFLSSYVDQNLLVGSLPGIRTVADVSDMPWEKITTSFEDETGYKHPFKKIMEGYGTKKTIDYEFFSYKQRFDGHDYMVILQDLNEDDPCPGKGGVEFSIVLNEGRLKYSDYINPANAKNIQARVVSKTREPYGRGWLYKLKYSTVSGEFFPKKYLKSQTKWEKSWAAAGEATSVRGSFMTSFNKGWIEYGNNMTTLTKQAKFTDKAEAQYLVYMNVYDKAQYGIEDMGEKIIDFAEAEFVAQTHQEVEKYFMWGTANAAPLTQSDVIDESSGYHVNVGTGFFGYAAYSTTRQYFIKKLTSKYVFDQLQGVVSGRLRFSDYNWAVAGGYKFIEAIINSNKREFGSSGFTTHFKDVTRPAAAIDTRNREGVAFNTKQFTEINFDPYGSLMATHWPDLDSPHFFGPDLKLEGHPVSSWWGFVFNLGLRGSAKKNIETYEKRNSEAYNFVIGMWGPGGPSNMNSTVNRRNSSHPGAWYELHWQNTVGFNMRNPEDMVWFLPNAQ